MEKGRYRQKNKKEHAIASNVWCVQRKPEISAVLAQHETKRASQANTQKIFCRPYQQQQGNGPHFKREGKALPKNM